MTILKDLIKKTVEGHFSPIPINTVRHGLTQRQPICLANLQAVRQNTCWSVSKSKVSIRVVAYPLVGLHDRQVCSLPSSFFSSSFSHSQAPRVPRPPLLCPCCFCWDRKDHLGLGLAGSLYCECDIKSRGTERNRRRTCQT